MTSIGWLQIVIYAITIVIFVKPLGNYMFRVFEGERQPLPRFFGAIERGIYKLCGVDPKEQQDWKQYALALLVFSCITLVVTYAIQRLQQVLPFNPQNLGPVSPDLAFGTASSFTTNTNWQAYGGEATMSYLSQMAGLAWHNFISAAAGIGVMLAIARGLTYRLAPDAPKTIGNFWVDLIRATLYLLLPMSIVVTIVLVFGGVLQNFSSYVEVKTLEGLKQTLAMGPTASQIAIKQLGTNGGGFFNVNSAHPFEGGSPLINFIEMWADSCHPRSADLHVWPHGARYEARVDPLRGDGDHVRHGRDHGLLFRSKAESGDARLGSGSDSRQHGGERGALWCR